MLVIIVNYNWNPTFNLPSPVWHILLWFFYNAWMLFITFTFLFATINIMLRAKTQSIIVAVKPSRPPEGSSKEEVLIIKKLLWAKWKHSQGRNLCGKEKGSEELDIDLAKWSNVRKYYIVNFFPLFSQVGPATQIRRTMPEMLGQNPMPLIKPLETGNNKIIETKQVLLRV